MKQTLENLLGFFGNDQEVLIIDADTERKLVSSKAKYLPTQLFNNYVRLAEVNNNVLNIRICVQNRIY